MKFNMEQCFRIALWMCLLICYLQVGAQPFNKPDPTRFNTPDLQLGRLPKECGHVTFNSTRNVQENCYNATLTLFKDGLEKASTLCTDKSSQIKHTLEALEQVILTGSSDCMLETKETDFKTFVADLTSFVQRVNNNNCKT